MTSFVAIDFETANRAKESACAVGLVRVENLQIVQKAYYLICPPQSHFEFTHIHGIRWTDVAAQPTFGDLWSELHPLIAGTDFIAAHNAGFDRAVLHACCNSYSIPRPAQDFICTVQLARRTWSLYPTKLPDVCRYLGLQLDHHYALSDAEACAQIVIAATQPIV